MSFIKDDGKGYVGVHAALDTPYEWPEYGKMNVLLSLDPSKLDYNNPCVHRTDHDFAVAWSKM
jgi:uncharacterized protein